MIDVESSCRGFEQHETARRQKAVPAHLFAADDAFEQARAAAVVDLVERLTGVSTSLSTRR